MNLFYREYGDGEPLLILHGLYGCSDNWVSFAKLFAQSGRKVIVPDLRNHGHSPHSSQHSFKLMAEDVINIIDDLKINSVDIIGHSMGGNLAIELARSYIDRVNKLIIVDAVPKNYLASKSHILNEHIKIIELMNKVNLGSFKSIKDIDLYLKKYIVKERFRTFLIKNIKKVEDKYIWRCNFKDCKSIVKNVSNFGEINNQIINQALFIKGSESDFITKDDYVLIADKFPNAQIEVVEGANHWVHAQYPVKFLEVCNNFLNKV